MTRRLTVYLSSNLFNADGSYYTYGGSVNGINIRYIDNLFGKAFGNNCAYYGPVANFDSSGSDNVWTGNRWQDGSGTVNAVH
jgi:hypothetical protein